MGKQVRLKLVYIDFWSAVKLSFLIALCLGIVTIVATFLVFTVLNGTSSSILSRADRICPSEARKKMAAAPAATLTNPR